MPFRRCLTRRELCFISSLPVGAFRSTDFLNAEAGQKSGQPVVSEHAILLWTRAANAVGAAATVATAIMALVAAKSWRLGLKQQRADECILAVKDCGSAIGRVVSHREMGRDTQWEHVPDAWTTWRRFRSSFAVVRRYYDLPDEGAVFAEGVAILRRLEAFCSTHGAVALSVGEGINVDFGVLEPRSPKP